MALPTSRDVTFAAGSQVPSATLNSIQDNIISAHFHGTRTLQLSSLGGSPGFRSDDWDHGSGDPFATGTDASGWVIGVPLRQGDRILAVRAFIDDNLGVAVTAALVAATHLGVASVVGSAVSSGGGAGQTLTIGPLTEAVDGTETYYVRCTPAGGASCRVYSCEVDYDRPVP